MPCCWPPGHLVSMRCTSCGHCNRPCGLRCLCQQGHVLQRCLPCCLRVCAYKLQLPDGVFAMCVGQLGSLSTPLVFVGGNCSILGLDALAQDGFWTVCRLFLFLFFYLLRALTFCISLESFHRYLYADVFGVCLSCVRFGVSDDTR